MREIFLIRKSKELNLLNSLIHDQVIDYDDLDFDEKKGILTIRFKGEDYSSREKIGSWLIFSKFEIPVRKYLINIAGIREYSILFLDGKGFQTGDDMFNYAEYDAQKEMLYIHMCIEKAIEMKVNGINLSVFDTGEVAGMKKYYSFEGVFQSLFK